jgi:NTP pyrophosphatase (non-canonical NTP hydrolase)
MTIQELMDESYQTAKEKGWTDDGRTFGDHISLMHQELSEALDYHRSGAAVDDVWTDRKGKLHGIPIELADELIRIAQFAKEKGINLEAALRLKLAYNKTRPFRHGGKVI